MFFLQTTKCDSMFQIILSSMEFESKIAMRRVSYDCSVETLLASHEATLGYRPGCLLTNPEADRETMSLMLGDV